MRMNIHKNHLRFACCVLLLVTGCSGAGQSVGVLFAAANSRLATARKAGAEQYAESELEEAVALLTEAETAIANKNKEARFLAEKALAKARLAEALALQLKAEGETTQLEAKLEKASSEADQARRERRAAESELERMTAE